MKLVMMAAALVLSMPVFALDPVAKVIDVDAGSVTNYYDNLQEAIAQCSTYGGMRELDLLADVDLSGVEWSPSNFYGVFDGQGHVISNLKVESTGSDSNGFFKVVDNFQAGTSLVHDLTISNATINAAGKEYVGVLAGKFIGIASNVTICGSIKVEGAKYVGGLAGWLFG